MNCEQVTTHLCDYLDPDESGVPRTELKAHLAACANCREHLKELQLLATLLHDRKAPPAPPDLLGRIRDRLAQEPLPEPVSRPLGRLINWPSLTVGAVAAGLVLWVGMTVLKSQTPLPSIQTAAVSVARPTSVNIGFDVERDVDGVTYTIDLPKGLEFLDANNQPVDAHSITWQGQLKRGKTVVPITVRGIQPGRYEILATVRKNQFAQTTKIVLPVEGRRGEG